jgi:osmotically-inducible protein OsmY
MWNDTELHHDVENEVAWDLRAGLMNIGVTVKGGAVELDGHVESFWEKCAAERAAWRVAHVSHVINEIRVVVPFNKQRDDDEIALAAMTILEWNCLVPETVEVQVAEACVTLSGNVERHCQKEEAARALCTLTGITGIHNDIVLQPSVILGDVKPLSGPHPGTLRTIKPDAGDAESPANWGALASHNSVSIPNARRRVGPRGWREQGVSGDFQVLWRPEKPSLTKHFPPVFSVCSS